jgi:hypothetical protein
MFSVPKSTVHFACYLFIYFYGTRTEQHPSEILALCSRTRLCHEHTDFDNISFCTLRCVSYRIFFFFFFFFFYVTLSKNIRLSIIIFYYPFCFLVSDVIYYIRDEVLISNSGATYVFSRTPFHCLFSSSFEN